MDEKKLRIKYFDLAESVVLKWLVKAADVLKLDINVDTNISQDVINTTVDDITYSFYLTMDDRPPKVNSDVLDKNENVQKAVSMLYDAVYNVYFPIVVSNNLTVFRDIMPEFDTNTLMFSLKMFNTIEQRKKMMLQQFMVEKDEKNKVILQQELQKLNNFDINTYEKSIEETNKLLSTVLPLRIVQDDKLMISNDIKYKRLPKFGVKYKRTD